MFKNILLAVDGSEHSMLAARQAGELARRMQAATLRVVIAYEPLPSFLGEPNLQAAISSRLRTAEEVLARATEVIGQVPAELHSEVLEGPPAEAILSVAETRQSDLIVMGTRGLGRLGSLLGSQSQKVASHAPCPVLIVR